MDSDHQRIINLNILNHIRPPKVALIQVAVHPAWLNRSTYKFLNDRVDDQTAAIRKMLNQALTRKPDFVVFPELSTPEKMVMELSLAAIKNNLFIIAGFEYSDDLRNICRVFTPDGQIYEYAKMYRSKFDHPKMVRGNQFNVFINTGYGDFAVLICYDYTDGNIINSLRGFIDILFVIALNRDTDAFIERAKRDCYDNYCYVAISNCSNYAYSCVYAPIHTLNGKRTNKLMKKSTEQEELCLFVTLDVDGLRKRISPLMEFKAPLAGYERRHLEAPPALVEETVLDADSIKVLLLASALRIMGGHERWKGNAGKLRILNSLASYRPASFEELLQISMLCRSSFHSAIGSLLRDGYVQKKSRHTYELSENGHRVYEAYLASLAPMVEYLVEKHSAGLPAAYIDSIEHLKNKMGIEETIKNLVKIKRIQGVDLADQASRKTRAWSNVEDLLIWEIDKIKRWSERTAGSEP